MALNRIVHLANDPTENQGFKKKRGFTKIVEQVEESDAPKVIRLFHQNRLRSSNSNFSRDRSVRNKERSIELLAHIDLVRIHFYSIFQFDLQKKFFGNYGLFGIEYDKFNKSVLFEIVSERKFARLVAEKSERVLEAKRKSRALAARMAPVPTQKTVERLTRKIWKFGEELRAHSIAADEVSG